MENNEIKNSKLIPRLRFPGFEGEWEEKKLGEVGTFIRGLSYSNTEVTQDTSTTLVIRSNNILQDGVVDLKDGLQFVAKTPSKEQLLKEGDVVICLANGSSNLVGKTATFDGNYTGIATVGAFCGIYRSVMPICKYLVQTSAYKNMINLIKQGGNGALANLYGKDILGLSFSFPSLPEQQKIASCLSELDNLIAAQGQKVDALKEKKKGLMQQLFPQPGETTPRLRFPGFEGEWEERKLGVVFETLSNSTLSRADLNDKQGKAMYVHYGDVLIKIGQVLDLSKEKLPYITDDSLAIKACKSILRNGDVIMADTAEDETVGKCTEIKNASETPVVSGLHTIPLRPLIRFADGFMGYYLNSDAYRKGLLPLMQGVKVTSLSRTAITGTSIKYPLSLSEQQKIASCLSSLDDLIAAESAKVEALKDHKKGLMQQLFPRPTK